METVAVTRPAEIRKLDPDAVIRGRVEAMLARAGPRLANPVALSGARVAAMAACVALALPNTEPIGPWIVAEPRAVVDTDPAAVTVGWDTTVFTVPIARPATLDPKTDTLGRVAWTMADAGPR